MFDIKTTGLLYLASSAASLPVSGAISQVFSETGLMMTIMGMLGGALNGIVNWHNFWTVLRPSVIGGLLAFGVGVLVTPILIRELGIDLGAGTSTAPTLGGGAFILGLAQERFIEFVRKKKEVATNESGED